MERTRRSHVHAWAARVLMLFAVLLTAAAARAELVQNGKLNFKMTIPDGFKPLPDVARGDVLHAFRREGITRATIGVVITVERMHGVLGREPLTDADVQKVAPGATLSTEPWKSFTVSVMRKETDIDGKSAVSYSAQIPLAPEAIQINVAGDRASDDEVHALLREVVAGTDGESSWLSDRDRTRFLGSGVVRIGGVVLGIGAAIWLVRRLRS